jgi:hypothetical protein
MTKKTQQEKQQETEKISTPPEIVEIEWEEAKDLVSIRAALLATEQQFSAALLVQEKQRAKVIARISELEAMLYEQASLLRDSKGVNEEITYELRLPDSEGAKGYFVKKED